MPRTKLIVLFLVGIIATLLCQIIPTASLQAVASEIPINREVFNNALTTESFIPAELEQSDEPLGNARAVIGADERQPVLSRAFPWSAVGRLEWTIGNNIISTCTATLVHADVVLTNSHCLLLPYRIEGSTEPSEIFVDAERYQQLLRAAGSVPKLIFKPSLINNVALDQAAITEVITGWEINNYIPAQDWALMRLDTPLGRQYGYLGWRALDFSNTNILQSLTEKISLVGYSGDFPSESLREFGQAATTAGVDRACSVLGTWPEGALADTIVHDCDTNSGASGGPILTRFSDGQYYIVGLHARRIPLNRSVTLPNGIDTRIINGGVQVHQWVQN